MIGFDLLMFFAILAGTVPAQPPVVQAPPMEQRRVVTRKPRTTLEFSFSKGMTPLPMARPQVASVPKADVVPTVVIHFEPYPFVWQGKYALPPNYVQIWKYIG